MVELNNMIVSEQYFYTVSCRDDEHSLRRMEERALFGMEASAEGWLMSKATSVFT